jgi:hypothetical protein
MRPLSNFWAGAGREWNASANSMRKPTQRSNCRFTVEKATDGKHVIALRLYQDTIPMLKEVSIGFDLLGGTRIEQAKKLAEMLNEHVLNFFVTMKEF